MTGTGKDVFISYRREGGAATARLIERELVARGFSVFLDVDDLGPSHFDSRLLDEIGRAPNFVVILSRDALDRCVNEGDWLRQEIAHAIAAERKIVPVMEEGFSFPPKAELPADIADLPRHQAVMLSFSYFGAAIDKLVGFLDPRRSGLTGDGKPGILYQTRQGKSVLMVQTFARDPKWPGPVYHISQRDGERRPLRSCLKVFGNRASPVAEETKTSCIANAIKNILDLSPDVVGLGGMGDTARQIRAGLLAQAFRGTVEYWGGDVGIDAAEFLRRHEVEPPF